jgi:hypothetical protein
MYMHGNECIQPSSSALSKLIYEDSEMYLNARPKLTSAYSIYFILHIVNLAILYFKTIIIPFIGNSDRYHM